MNIAISHSDSDGLLSVVMLLKAKGNENVERVYFTSPNKILRTICNCATHNGCENFLYIFDTSARRETMYASAMFTNSIWIDHHIWEESIIKNKPPNVEFYIDSNAKSATYVAAKFFNINSKLVDYANEIDSNNIKSEGSERIFHIVGSYRRESKFQEMLNFARKIAEDENEIFNKIYDPIIEGYKKWIEYSIKIGLNNLKIEKIESNNKTISVGIIDSDFILPFSKIYDNLDVDILLGIANERENIKVEFRSKNFDVYKIAKELGGGGHKFASGATLNKNEKEKILETLKNLLKTNANTLEIVK
ncbi:MAG: DHHA1 domain-containing protein [Candidatus Altarchaeaceae archaeon]